MRQYFHLTPTENENVLQSNSLAYFSTYLKSILIADYVHSDQAVASLSKVES